MRQISRPELCRWVKQWARSRRSKRLKLGFGIFEYFELISRQSGYFARIGNDARDAPPQLRAYFLPADLSFYVPVIARARRSVDAGGGGSGVVAREDIGPFSDLLQWSATLSQGAEVLTNVQGDLSAGVSTALPAPSWVAETGPAPETDQSFSKTGT